MAKKKARHPESPRGWKGISKTVKVWVVLALACSVLAGILTQWPRWFPIDPMRQVTIYRTHGCRCAFVWAQELESKGYVVTMYEPETLKTIRGALKTPPSLRGCHVGRYMEYFVEGHVPAEALGLLARQHPAGLGVAADSTAARHEPLSSPPGGKPGVTLYDKNGIAHLWWTGLGA
jgi:hypothetical protein